MNEFSAAFGVALSGTLKVFAMGFCGWWFVRRGWLPASTLQPLGQLIAFLTLPCLIFYRFATRFDPQEFPDWPKYALIGGAITGVGLLLGRLISLRHRDNNEATMMIGFQNAGFFVLPMLQAILPADQFPRASLLLFVLIIPFNALLWLAGSQLLLGKSGLSARVVFTPPFCATIGSVLLFSLGHDFLHQFDNSLPWHVMFGDEKSVGAVQLIGDLTVPLATIVLGASIGADLQGKLSELQWKRATLEVMFVKMLLYPFIGWLVMRAFLPPISQGGDTVIWVLLMLEFASPPAINVPVFARQHDYQMRYIPAACLLSYGVGMLTIPFWIALISR